MALLLQTFSTCHSLRHVALSIEHPSGFGTRAGRAVYSGELVAVEQALLQIEHLETVIILKGDRVPSLEHQAALSKGMPTLHSRGILKFEVDRAAV